MGVRYILYNPYAGNGGCKEDAKGLAAVYDDSVIINMSRINSYQTFFEGLEPDAEVIICGGDGTLNRFVNGTKDAEVNTPVFYFAAGTGNDFARDLGHGFHDAPDYRIDSYIKELPSVTVNGKTSFFLNGAGYGVDGACRERERGKKELPIHFKPRSARITVDGAGYTYEKVWVALTLKGRFYGGGLMPALQQDRRNTERKVTLMVLYGCGRLRAMRIFHSFLRGKHIKYKKQVSVLEGKEITVEFDRPAPLQMDGEAVLDAASYTVSAQRDRI